MKHLVFKLSVLALVAMALVSCEKKEPTALNEDNIAGSGTICGYVSYNYNSSTTNFKSNADVYVDVDLSSINSKLTGYKRYTTSTDSKGYYEVVVPTQPGNSAKCKVSTSFIADCEYGNDVVTGEFYNAVSDVTVTDGYTIVTNVKAGNAQSYPYAPNLNK